MSKWSRIKNTIINQKTLEVDNVLSMVEENIGNIPRSSLALPIKSWISKQKLSLDEYVKLNGIARQINASFTESVNCRSEFNNHSNLFKQAYLEILNNKEEEFKLITAAELVEEQAFPLEELVSWYLNNQELSSEQFNEALGEFWGDLWKHAKHGAKQGAGVGALAGATGGSLAGLGGTFAGAGLGGLVGGLTGGLYGGGKHLLKHVWNYRKNQVEFDRTKEQALEILNKLKSQAANFEMDTNFKKLLDSMIEKLGTAKAYRVVQPEVPKIVEPQKPPQVVPSSTKEEPSITPQEPELVVPSSPKEEPSITLPPEEPEKQEPPVFKPRKKRGRVPLYKVVEEPKNEKPEKQPIEEPKSKTFEEIKSMHDLMNYMEIHHKELPILGLALDTLGWEPDDNVEKISFEDLYKEIETFKHLTDSDSLEEAHHHRDLAEKSLTKLKEAFGLPIGTAAMESIRNKYLKLLL